VRVLFTSTAGEGHFRPLTALVGAFAERGDKVLVIAPPKLASTLEASGFDFRLGDEPSTEDSERVWSRFPTLARHDASRLVEREWFATLCLQAMLPTVERAVEDFSPDLIVRETCEYAAAVVADERGLAQAQVAISTASAESSVLLRLAGPILERRSEGIARRVYGTPYLTRFPASLDPSPYPTTFRYRERDNLSAKPLPDWWNGSEAPLIYLTIGTVATGRPRGRDVLSAVLESLAGLDARILVTTSTKLDPTEFDDAPSNVHVEPWVDQADAFAEASLVVCHGGSGTTLGALGAGVPLVLLPMFADQPTNAELVERVGAGIAVAPGTESADVNATTIEECSASLREAVEVVLHDPRYREASLAMATEINCAASPRDLVDHLATRI